MARPAYSALLGLANSVSSPQSLGGPPPGYLWVVRDAYMTIGSFLAYVRGAFSLNNQDPRLWLFSTSSDQLIGVPKQTLHWQGRIVVPDGSTLWAQADSGDAGDFAAFGYVLLVGG